MIASPSAGPREPKVSVVIPVLNPGPGLRMLLERLRAQQPKAPNEIVLVDSGSTDGSVDAARARPEVRVVEIERFTHGGARNMGARCAVGEVVVFMTQDAVPADDAWLERLLHPLADPRVAAVYARQVPRENADPVERFFLEEHFPAGGVLKRGLPVGRPLRLWDLFFSNVSSAVRRAALMDHPFDEALVLNEDQQFARDLLTAGWLLAYQPQSVVVHSHGYTPAAVFRRYFDVAAAVGRILPAHGVGVSVRLGLRRLTREALYVARHRPGWLPSYALVVAARAAGVLAGHAEPLLPRRWVRRLSLHPAHW